jgi:hypothetical protein
MWCVCVYKYIMVYDKQTDRRLAMCVKNSAAAAAPRASDPDRGYK